MRKQYIKKCLQCKNIFKNVNKKVKHCSRKCTYLSQIGKKRTKETCLKISIANRKPHTEERKKNISIARTKKYNKNIIDKIKFLLKNKYYPLQVICKEVNIPYDRRVFVRTINEIFSENKTLLDINIQRKKLTSNIHLKTNIFDKWKIDWLIKNYNKYDATYIKNYLGLGITEQKIEKLCLRWFGIYKKRPRKKYQFHGGKTKPEQMFENFLIELKVDYEYNKMFGVKTFTGIIYYSIDFYIEKNIFIEIQGDYWHANPMFYTINNLNGIQRNAINRDRRKKAQIINNFKNCNYFQIWEYDIKNNTKQYLNQKKEIIQCIHQNMTY